MANDDRTEKATPKHRKRAREKGEVARSPDLGGSIVVVAGLFALSLMGSRIVDAAAEMFHGVLAEIGHPDQAMTAAGLGALMHAAISTVAARRRAGRGRVRARRPARRRRAGRLPGPPRTVSNLTSVASTPPPA